MTRKLLPYLAAFCLFLVFGKRAELSSYASRDERLTILSPAVALSGFVERAGALLLPPGRGGKAVFTYAKPRGFVMDLWPTIVSPARAALTTDLRREPLVLLRRGVFIWRSLIDARVQALVEPAAEVVLTLEARNDGREEFVVLKSLAARVHDAPRGDFFVFPEMLFAAAVYSNLLAFWAVLVPRKDRFHAGAAALTVLGSLVFAKPGFPAALVLVPAVWSAAAICAAAAFLRSRALLTQRAFLGLTGVLWAAVAAQFCWQLAALSPHCYFHDSIDYYTQYGRELRLFSDRGFYSASFGLREPFHPFLLSLWGKLFGGTPFAGLNFTLLSLTGYAFLAYVLVGSLVPNPWITTALGPAFAMQSVYGELIEGLQRESTYFIFMVVVLYAGMRGRPGLLTAAAALATLTRATALSSFAAAAALAATARLCGPRRAFLFIAVVATALAPHMLAMHRRHGSASYPYDFAARIYANDEFKERHGTPGFPTPEQYALDAASGPPLKYRDYVFKMHSPRRLVEMHLNGWLAIFSHHADAFWAAWGVWTGVLLRLAVWAVLAGGTWILGRQLLPLWGWYVLQNLYSAMLYKSVIPVDRAVDHALPTFLLLLGFCAAALTGVIVSELRSD